MPFVNAYWIFYFVASYVSSHVEKVKYDGAQVWRTALRSAEDVLLIKRLIDNQDISIWNLCPTKADFLVRAEHKVKVYRQLSARNLSHTVLIMDVQRRIDTQPVAPSLWTETTLRVAYCGLADFTRPKENLSDIGFLTKFSFDVKARDNMTMTLHLFPSHGNIRGHRLNWKKFPTLNIIEEYYNFLADDYSSICKVQNLGYTSENRTIKMINITNGNPDNKVMLVTGGLHAREWISVTSALYILHTIVTKFDKQHAYIQNINWLIIPVMNPDGYVYTHTGDRLWRKNRRKFMYCKGVDINRNFDTDWGVAGISENNECKGTYSGPYPFSEAESIVIRNLIKSSKVRPIGIVDLHAYGNLILFPWSAKNHATPDLQMHRQAAEEMSRAIFKSTKSNYTFGATYHVIYPATGTLLDWAYANGVSHAYVIESRDKGEFGFLLPPEEIEETGKELYGALRYLAKHISQGYENQTWF